MPLKLRGGAMFWPWGAPIIWAVVIWRILMGVQPAIRSPQEFMRFPSFPPELPPHPPLTKGEVAANLATPPFGIASEETHPLTHPSRVIVSGFAAGTIIETPQGGRAVETLKPGDMVLALETIPHRVGWIGTRHFEAADAKGPVTIAPGAVGNGSVLTLSPGTRLHLPRGILRAEELVEGGYVHHTPDEAVTYHAFQCDTPVTILANGAAVRLSGPSVLSLLDRGTERAGRMAFS